IYAESEDRCLADLRSTDPRHDKIRIEQTKDGLLRDAYKWVLGNDEFQRWRFDEESTLLWVKGDPGKGKTMLLCGIIDELDKSIASTDLLYFFFCQAADARINSATTTLRGLIYLLVKQQPSLDKHVRKRYEGVGKQLFEDVNAWTALSEILTDILRDPDLQSTFLIIDALDECVTGLPLLLAFIAQQSCTPSRVKWLVSSRNWPNIEKRLELATRKVRLSLELSISAAVGVYIRSEVDRLAQIQTYDQKTRDDVSLYLSSNANDTFLWVALVCQGLREVPCELVPAKLRVFPPGRSRERPAYETAQVPTEQQRGWSSSCQKQR
ncbi:heterokaryon incompatibility protein, partial [Bombardia bombarda]